MKKLTLLSLSLLMISACNAMDESNTAQDYKDYCAHLYNSRNTVSIIKTIIKKSYSPVGLALHNRDSKEYQEALKYYEQKRQRCTSNSKPVN